MKSNLQKLSVLWEGTIKSTTFIPTISTLQTASVVQSNYDSLVIENEMSSVKSDALRKALGLQSKTGIKPYLLQVK